MGCCVSTGKPSSLSKDQNLQVGNEDFIQRAKLESRAPPPSAEEETVKEVLSETPKPKPHFPISRQELEIRKTLKQKPTAAKIQAKETIDFSRIEQKSPTKVNNAVAIEESVSEEVSDICSLSYSESVSTTTINERRDDDEEVRQRVFRSPVRTGVTGPRSRDSVPKRDRGRVVGRSPNRRPDQSPGRRTPVVNGGSVRLVQSKEPGQAMPRRGQRPDLTRRDPGESSGRRSRSPSVNRSTMGRSPSARRANRSPGRVRVDPVDSGNIKKGAEESSNLEGKWPRSNNNNCNAAANNTANESLENPLVSLECFIFL